MSVLFRYQAEGLTRQQYDAVSERLQSSGAWPPDGLELHVCFGSESDLRVSEIWASEDKQRAFAESALLPTLREVGVGISGAPETFPVHEVQIPRVPA